MSSAGTGGHRPEVKSVQPLDHPLLTFSSREKRGKNTKTEDAELKLRSSAGQLTTIESVRAADETSSLAFQTSLHQKWLLSSKSLIITCITFFSRAAACSETVTHVASARAQMTSRPARRAVHTCAWPCYEWRSFKASSFFMWWVEKHFM